MKKIKNLLIGSPTTINDDTGGKLWWDRTPAYSPYVLPSLVRVPANSNQALSKRNTDNDSDYAP